MTNKKAKDLLSKPFAPNCFLKGFSPQEVSHLKKYGNWLQALMDGDLTPTTPEQRHFVKVCQGQAKPSTGFEILWTKYMALLDEASTKKLRYHVEVMGKTFPFSELLKTMGLKWDSSARIWTGVVADHLLKELMALQSKGIRCNIIESVKVKRLRSKRPRSAKAELGLQIAGHIRMQHTVLDALETEKLQRRLKYRTKKH